MHHNMEITNPHNDHSPHFVQMKSFENFDFRNSMNISETSNHTDSESRPNVKNNNNNKKRSLLSLTRRISRRLKSVPSIRLSNVSCHHASPKLTSLKNQDESLSTTTTDESPLKCIQEEEHLKHSNIAVVNVSFKEIPLEIIFDKIFPFLFPSDLLRCSWTCKLFHSYLFDIIDGNDMLWQMQLKGLLTFLKFLTFRKRGTNVKHVSKHFCYGKLQEFSQRLQRRILYFQNLESLYSSSNLTLRKVTSVPLVRSQSCHKTLVSNVSLTNTTGPNSHSIWNQSNSEPTNMEICESIRETIISECESFLSSFETFGLKHVYLNEIYDPSKLSTLPPAWIKSSKRHSTCHHSSSNTIQLQIQKSSTNSTIFNSESELDHWPSFRMAFVGCSERAVHPAIVQTFAKDSFPTDYISSYGQNIRCGIHLTTTTGNVLSSPSSPSSTHSNRLNHSNSPSSSSTHSLNHSFSTCQNGNQHSELPKLLTSLKLVDMSTDVWKFPHEANVYLKSSDCVVIFFNVRYESSFTHVCEIILPTIQKHAPLSKIILVGIDWLSILLEDEYESLKYKLSSYELIQLEPISSERVIRQCCSKHSNILGFISFTPQDATRDILNLMDVILKLSIGWSHHVNANLFGFSQNHHTCCQMSNNDSLFSSNLYKTTTVLNTTTATLLPNARPIMKKSLSLYEFFKKKSFKKEKHTEHGHFQKQEKEFSPLKSFKKFLSKPSSPRE
ncbi:hypothetical protein C9374_005003 [Naegleria lovaniensis]|uniref:F-box domain-containing protein n=1 Tax=Naegleria lovaniensis TaxID=51637 RepID=A0AA88GPS0_NAELO|nr:uncharacterized protein C9374_005003 [Naegleria lovaniensis]KAG2383036.1 hypothetical protein C9374_005003 [Naegleria lovaniensis]